jgi:hypothetical protein
MPAAATRRPISIWAWPIRRAPAGSKSTWSKRISGSISQALGGSTRGQECRAEIAEEMTAREIAEAQKQARAWLGATMRHAA